jgi:hypothetical protein
MMGAAREASASPNGVRATAPAIRRAAELGVDLASLRSKAWSRQRLWRPRPASRRVRRRPTCPCPSPPRAGWSGSRGSEPGSEPPRSSTSSPPMSRRWRSRSWTTTRAGGPIEWRESRSWVGRTASTSTTPRTASTPRWFPSAHRSPLERGSASCAASSASRSQRDRPQRPDRGRGGVRRWERRLRVLPLRRRYARRGQQLPIRVQLLRSSQRPRIGHLDRTRLHDLGPGAHRRSGTTRNRDLRRAARGDRRGRPGSVGCCDCQLRAGGACCQEASRHEDCGALRGGRES